MNKIKYFKLKRDGSVAKSPQYFNEIGREFCYEILNLDGETVYYTYKYYSLFEIFKEVLLVDDKHFGEAFLKNEPLSLNQIKQFMKEKVDNQILSIQSKLHELVDKAGSIKILYEKSVGNIDFDAFQKENVLNEYVNILETIKKLNRHQIIINEFDERDFLINQEKLISDVTPIVF